MLGPNLIFYVLGGALIACIVAFFKGRLDGAKLERANQAASEQKARDIADRIDSDPLPADVARKELGKWSRG